MEEGSCMKYLKQLKIENEMFQEYLAVRVLFHLWVCGCVCACACVPVCVCVRVRVSVKVRFKLISNRHH